jgi:uncharacterized glyoxalase superfamily protein PhnB
MSNNYKPAGYNSVSPYFVVDGAAKLMDLLLEIFKGEVLSKYNMPDGTILHAEIRIEDSILMFGNASEEYPPNKLLTHVYVPDVDAVYKKAIELGCTPVQKPKEREGDPDRRGMFRDFAGNEWAVGTQINMDS